jgi:cyclic pyranopterin phosphate synthase
MSKLTHFDDEGAARMVDVGAKDITERTAIAEGRITMRPETLARIQNRDMEKGDVLQVARLAGIMAGKKTSDLIPLCHPLPLTSIKLDLTCNDADSAVDISATVKTTGRTGVEMEALTAVSVAGLTVYDMCKAIDRDMVIGEVRLAYKAGGKSGTYRRGDAEA